MASEETPSDTPLEATPHRHHHRKHLGSFKRLNASELAAFSVLCAVGGAVIAYILQGTPELPNVKHVGCYKSDAAFSQVWCVERRASRLHRHVHFYV